METSEGGHIRANGIRQHYLHFEGAGRCVLIVPGIITPAVLWRHVGVWLSARYESYILDVRGRGLSESGPHLDYGFDACAQDLIGFARSMALPPVILLGHSMGARIALRAASKATGLFKSVVLVDPPTSGQGRRPYPIPKARTLGLLRAARRGEIPPSSPQGSRGLPWPQELMRLRAEWLPTCDERAVHVAYDDFHGAPDLFEDLARVDIPVSLICAGKGGVVSDQDVEEMTRIRPCLQSVRLPEVGHQMQAESFSQFSRALDEMLRRQDLSANRSDL